VNMLRSLFVGATVVALGTPVFADDMTSAKPMTYNFAAQNGSGETGTVTLTPGTDGTTTVTIALTGAPADAQPAHIHPGTCAKLNPAPKYPLNNVVNGASTTVVKAPMDKLVAGGFAVNVHKSTSDLGTCVSCADLGGSGAMGSMKM
jgi:hypothetical protein